MTAYDPSLFNFDERWVVVPGEIMKRGLDLSSPRRFNPGASDAVAIEVQNNSKKYVILGTQSREEDGMHYEIGSNFKFKRDAIAFYQDPGVTNDLYDVDNASMEFNFDKKKNGHYKINGLILTMETEGGTQTTVAFEGTNFKHVFKGSEAKEGHAMDHVKFNEVLPVRNNLDERDTSNANWLLNELFPPSTFLNTDVT